MVVFPVAWTDSGVPSGEYSRHTTSLPDPRFDSVLAIAYWLREDDAKVIYCLVVFPEPPIINGYIKHM